MQLKVLHLTAKKGGQWLVAILKNFRHCYIFYNNENLLIHFECQLLACTVGSTEFRTPISMLFKKIYLI
jgi:hypothetical protein